MVRRPRVAPKLASAVLALALGNMADAGTLRKIWDFDSAVILGAQSPGIQLGVFALGFSRDGRRIAAVIGRSRREESVLILDSRAPDAHFVKLDVNPQIREQEPGAGSQRIEWSLSGRQVILAKWLVQIPTGATCTLPAFLQRYRFTGDTQIVGYQVEPARLLFLDSECHITAAREMANEQHVHTYDASAERGLLLLNENGISHYTITEVSVTVIDVNGKQILRALRNWPASDALIVNPKFADSGKAFCGMRGDLWHRTIACFTVDAGQALNVTNGWNDPDVRTALGSPRIVISDYTKKLDWLDMVWYPGLLRKRVVWDFQSGKEIVRWKPKTQKVLAQPYRFDIAPDGEYIVEGGAGVVSLYKIEP